MADIRKYLAPVIWLQVYLSLYALPALVLFFLVLWLIIAFWTTMALSTSTAFLLTCAVGVPFFFLNLAFWFLFGTLYQASVAYVLRGMEVKDAVPTAFRACMDDQWRIVAAVGFALLAYIVLSVGLQTVFGILGILPFIGILFHGIGFLATTVLSLYWSLYNPALFVALVEEREA